MQLPPDSTTQQQPEEENTSRDVPMDFRGKSSEYFKIWIVNTCLTILTLGIYSAWAKVRTKRYFLGNTYLDGIAFDYDADPIKILKGRLIIAALFGSIALSQHFSLFIYFGLLVLLICVAPLIVNQALSFNARYSSHRNIRFVFAAKLGEAYKVFFALPLLMPLTLGLIHPYTKKRQISYVMNAHRFGSLPFRFRANLGDFWAIYGIAIGIGAVIVIGVSIALVAAFSHQVMAGISESGPGSTPMKPDLTTFWVVYTIAYVAALYVAAFLKASLTNLMWNNSRLDRHTFQCRLTGRRLYAIYLTNLLAVVFSLGLATPWALIRLARYRASCMTVCVAGDLDVMASEIQKEIGTTGDAAMDLGDFDVDLGI